MLKQKARILITGVAGFIGYHSAWALCAQGHSVLGLDSLTRYYSVSLKKDRLKQLIQGGGDFRFVQVNITKKKPLHALFADYQPEIVIHLAAQAGVRYAVDHPEAYGQSNLLGFLNVLEACRHYAPCAHVLYASSSSVYGDAATIGTAHDTPTDLSHEAPNILPLRESAPCGLPLSLYGASKRSNELMAAAYGHLYGMKLTGLRFFTVYGPYGRPDMALFRFTQALLAGRPLPVYNQGNMWRSFTYIQDVVAVLQALLPQEPPAGKPRLLNVGTPHSYKLRTMIDHLVTAWQAHGLQTYSLDFLPFALGDVWATQADTQALDELIGQRTWTTLPTGIAHFVNWYKDYYPLRPPSPRNGVS